MYRLAGFAFLFYFFLGQVSAQILEPLRNNVGFEEGLEYVTNMVFSADGKFAYTGGDSGLGVFQIANDGRPISIDMIVPLIPEGQSNQIGAVAISHDGKFVYASPESNDIFIYQRNSTTGMLTLQQDFTPPEASLPFLKSFISPDDKFMYVGSGTQIHIFARDLATGALTFVDNQAYDDGSIKDFIMTADGSRLYGVNMQNSSLRGFNRDSGTGKLTNFQTTYLGLSGIYEPLCLAFGTDETSLYVGMNMGIAQFAQNSTTGVMTFTKLFSYPTPELQYYANGPVELKSMSVNSNGTRLDAVAGGGGNLTSWQIDAGTGALSLLQRSNGFGLALFRGPSDILYEPQDDDAHFRWLTETSDGKLVADSTVKGTSLNKGMYQISAQAISTDGQTIFMASKFDSCITAYDAGLGNQNIFTLKSRLNYNKIGASQILQAITTLDQKNLFLLNEGTDLHSLISIATDNNQQLSVQQTLSFSTTIVTMALTSDNRSLYLITADNTLHHVSRSTDGTLTETTQWIEFNGTSLAQVRDLALSADAKYVYLFSAASVFTGSIFVLARDLNTGALSFASKNDLPEGQFGSQIVMGLGDSKLLYLTYGIKIYSLERNPDDGSLAAFVDNPFGSDSNLPPSAKLVIHNDLIFLVNADLETSTPVLKFDADGSIIVYSTLSFPALEFYDFSVGPSEGYLFSPVQPIVYGMTQFGNGVWVHDFVSPQPPAYPVGLKVTPGIRSITVSWKPRPGNNVQYKIYHSLGDAQPGNLPVLAQVSDTTYLDQNLTYPGREYYWVKTVVDGIESIFSPEVSAYPIIPLSDAPTNLAATAGDGFISLTWDASNDADFKEFYVFRSTTGTDEGSYYATTTHPSFKDSAVYDWNTYYYTVDEVHTDFSESLKSPYVTAALVRIPPSQPKDLAFVAGDQSVQLTWAANTESDFNVYVIYRRTTVELQGTNIAGVTGLQYTDNSVVNGTTYVYWLVGADRSNNYSIKSDSVFATPGTGVPNAPTGLTVTLDNSTVNLTWTANTEADLQGYQVFRGITNLTTSAISVGSVTSPHFEDGTPTPGVENYYWVRAVNQQNQVSPFSLPVDLVITGLADKDRMISVFPNPVSDELMITSNQNLTIESLELYDITGSSLHPAWDGHRVGMHGYPAGVYILMINSGTQRLRIKVLKK
jgi:fibronectin type 3 domain-containing protein